MYKVSSTTDNMKMTSTMKINRTGMNVTGCHLVFKITSATGFSQVEENLIKKHQVRSFIALTTPVSTSFANHSATAEKFTIETLSRTVAVALQFMNTKIMNIVASTKNVSFYIT